MTSKKKKSRELKIESELARIKREVGPLSKVDVRIHQKFIKDPKTDTDEGFQQFIQKVYRPSKNGEKSKRKPDSTKLMKARALIKNAPRKTHRGVFNYLSANGISCTLAWVKKHYKFLTALS